MKLNEVQFWPHLYKSLAQGTDPSTIPCPVCPQLGKPHLDLRGVLTHWCMYRRRSMEVENLVLREQILNQKGCPIARTRHLFEILKSCLVGGKNSLALHDPRGQAQWVETTGRKISSPNRMQTAPILSTNGRWKDRYRQRGWVTNMAVRFSWRLKFWQREKLRWGSKAPSSPMRP